MALKKYRIFVGMCGPTPLYSDTIRAEDERAAVITYLTEIGKEVTIENINEQLRHVREIVPNIKKTPEKLLDCLGKELTLGADVMFMRRKYGEGTKLMSGKVDKVSGKSIVVRTQSGESNRIMLSTDSDDSIDRVIVMAPRPERVNGEVLDASGYPILEGDTVAYMIPAEFGTSDGFGTGTVTKFTAKSVEVNGTKRPFDRVVVINW